MTWIAVILGGALGSVARHGVNLAVARVMGSPGPYATATVNMLGSFAVGLLAGALASQRLTMTPSVRAFVFVGVLGGFTTFSSFMLDALTQLERGTPGGSVINLVGQVLVGFVLVYIGYRLGVRR
jgi:fluoride exporter